MAIGDSDQQEAQNMKKEEELNKLLLNKVKTQYDVCKKLAKNYKGILKSTKKVSKLIKRKEDMNQEELKAEWGKLQSQTDTGKIRAMAKRLKADEENESNISKEEAMLIQEMLTNLHQSIQNTQNILKENTEIYNVLNEIYSKDMQDYQLEVASLKKA